MVSTIAEIREYACLWYQYKYFLIHPKVYMTNENVWFENRKKIVENNKFHDKLSNFGSLWLILFLPIYLFLKHYIFKIQTPLASVVGIDNVLILLLLVWFGPNILLTQIVSYKKISDVDLIACQLYRFFSYTKIHR